MSQYCECDRHLGLSSKCIQNLTRIAALLLSYFSSLSKSHLILSAHRSISPVPEAQMRFIKNTRGLGARYGTAIFDHFF